MDPRATLELLGFAFRLDPGLRFGLKQRRQLLTLCLGLWPGRLAR